MFIGHLALGFAAKRVVPRLSLGVLMIAAQWADIIWPLLVGLGIEVVAVEPGNTAFTPLNFISYPYSHSLIALLGWALLVGIASRGLVSEWRTAWVVGALVISHWLLDVITHRPDMPLYPGSVRYGLSLWNSVPATIGVEGLLFALGLWIYVTSTVARDAVGRWGLVALVAVLIVIYVANIASVPPDNSLAIAIVGLAGAALFGTWAWWVDRHRDLRART